MINKNILATAILAGVAILPQAHAGEWYGSANIGYSDSSSKVFNDGANGDGNPKTTIESDTIFGLALGYKLSPALKIELEYSVAGYSTNNALKKGNNTRALDDFSIDADLDVDLLMLNASYEFHNSSDFTPYLKAGVGSTFYDAKSELFVGSFGGDTFGGFLPATFSYKGDGNEFAYFVGAGVFMDLAEDLELTLEYRYTDLGEVATSFDEAGDRIQTDMTTSNIQIGLRYSF